MTSTKDLIETYLNYCHTQKRLDEKTLKAYRIDLRQFTEFILGEDIRLIHTLFSSINLNIIS